MTSILALIFSSHMVLQRGADIPVWGFMAAGTNVSVSFGAQTFSATSDPTGRWAVTFPAMSAGGPYVLSANATSGEQQVLEDVLVGDVVLCSGQSNVDMPISYAFNATAEAAAAALYPSLRYFQVNANYSNTPLREFISTSRWEEGTSASVASSFSAVCWFAVRDTYDALRASGEEVALGLIHSALGGTPIQYWMSSTAAATCPPALPPMYPAYSRLYNAMIAPMVLNGMRTSHTIWYQGEANVLQSHYYACMLKALSDDWQGSFQQRVDNSSGRFFVVQLHAWNASTDPTNVYYQGAIAGQRMAQAQGVADSPGAELATAIDGGDPLAPATSIHPRNKQLPGHRLALAILARRYSMPHISYAAPRYASATASASGVVLTVTVSVSNSSSSSTTTTGTVPLVWVPPTPDSNSSRCPTDLGVLPIMCAGFEVMLSDGPFPNGTWIPATAAVDGEGSGVVLTATAPRPGLVAAGTRNGWGAWPVVNVYARDGFLPLLPWQNEVISG